MTPTPTASSPWWRDGVVYEVYPRSFADSDGDGVGDLRGLVERLPYLASLGVDGLWLTPFQRSPQVDQGYDISDYCDVDPLFGDLAAFDDFLAAAHAAGLRVLIDTVPNHTSSRNALFERAVAAAPGSPERALFHFRPGRGEHAAEPPNNWLSVFGGAAWSRDDGQRADDPEWYLHLFSPGQPDWNWEDPRVREMFDGVLRFWFDRGVDGMRIDVAHGLFKHPGLPDTDVVPEVIDGLRSNPLAMDQEPVHEVYRHWRRIADGYEPPRLLVGEVNLAPQRAARYTRPDELHQSFAFAFAKLDWEAAAWVAAGNELAEAAAQHGTGVTWALENHDITRTATRFGGGVRGRVRASTAVAAMLGLPGGVYVYQGQELGLPEVDVPEADRVDPMWFRGGVCRDGARVPLPWTADPSGTHGFSSGRPWLPVPDGWGAHAVSVQEGDPTSPLRAFRSAVAARRELRDAGVLRPDAEVRWQARPDGSVEARRSDGVSVLIAMGDEPVVLPAGRVLFATAPIVDGAMPADQVAWVLRAGG